MKLSVFILSFFLTSIAFSQTDAETTLLKKLESSGALDRAVQRSLDKIKKQEAKQQQKEIAFEEEQKAKMAKNLKKIDPKEDHIYGKKDAVVTIYVFSDFECPFCQRFHETPKKLVNEMPDKVNLVFRHFPLGFHEPMASKEATAALCAFELGGNDKFWSYADTIMFKTQLDGKGIATKNDEDPLLEIAKALNLNADKFNECRASEKVAQRIKDNIADGSNAGINGTPGVILRNNKTNKVSIMAGAVPVEMIRQAAAKLLN
jgi:protein-disulfide isomerase